MPGISAVVEGVYRRRLAGLNEVDALWQAALAGALLCQGVHPDLALEMVAPFARPLPPATDAMLAWPGRPVGMPRTIWGPLKATIAIV